MKPHKAKKSKPTRSGVPFSLSSPADLQSKVQKLQLAIARRAHELFEARGQEHGHDLDDWLQAESELLCPVSVAMSQSNDCVKLRADLAGFGQSMNSLVGSLWSDEDGQDIAEYAVMLAVILVVVVGTLRLIGSNTNNVFSSVASTLQ